MEAGANNLSIRKPVIIPESGERVRHSHRIGEIECTAVKTYIGFYNADAAQVSAIENPSAKVLIVPSLPSNLCARFVRNRQIPGIA